MPDLHHRPAPEGGQVLALAGEAIVSAPRALLAAWRDRRRRRSEDRARRAAFRRALVWMAASGAIRPAAARGRS